MTIFGIGPFEFVIIVVIALVVVGPERLPEMMFQIGQFINKAKRMVLDLREQARAELGDDYETIEQFGRQLRDLNPRRQIEELGRSILEEQPPLKKGDMPVSPTQDLGPVPTPKQVSQELQALMHATLDDDLLDKPLAESLEDAHDQ